MVNEFRRIDEDILKIEKKHFIMLWTMGLLFAVLILLSKQLLQGGMHPVHIAFSQAIGSALSIWVLNKCALPTLEEARRYLGYFATASLLGFTVPQLIALYAMPHTGVGLVTLSFALPLVVAYTISLAIRLEDFNVKRLVFIVLTVFGSVVYVSSHLDLFSFDRSNPWNYLLLLSPLSIGVANIYRTVKWPKTMVTSHIALLTSVFTVITYAGLLFLPNVESSFELFSSPALLTILVATMVLAGIGQLILFRLQKTTGPVFVGQTGSIVALTGGVLGFIFFGEPYTAVTLAGSLMIVVGVYRYSQLGMVAKQEG